MSSVYDKKSPAFLEPTYPYKAVGESLDFNKFSDEGYINIDSLYELKCPNCNLSVHIKGTRLQEYYNKLLEVGCPDCKLQFNGKKYIFKDGETEKPLPENNGKFEGFIVKKVIKVPENIFDEYAKELFDKEKELLTAEEGQQIAEKFFKGE